MERGGVSIMLQEYREEFRHATKLGEGVSVCITCNDALILYHEFIQKGLRIAEPFVGNNYWVVALQDPDGYKILFERPTDVPEETIFSDWQKNKS